LHGWFISIFWVSGAQFSLYSMAPIRRAENAGCGEGTYLYFSIHVICNCLGYKCRHG